MFFLSLVFITAFAMEAIGTVISIMGLTQLFGFNYIIVSMATIFDIAKLLSVSFLYKEWKVAPSLLRGYMLSATAILMVISSAGVAGYLSSTFQKAILPTQEIAIKVGALEEEKKKLEARKLQIDNQIANLPADTSRGRTRLIANFKSETERLNSRITELDTLVPQIKLEAIDKTSHAGPITYLSKALGVSIEFAMGIIILMIIGVFDPLAIALILAGNYLLAKRNFKNPAIAAPEDVIFIPEVENEIEIEPEIIIEPETELPIHRSILADASDKEGGVTQVKDRHNKIVDFYNQL